jgi:uncharacterized protein (TIGR02453 family)
MKKTYSRNKSWFSTDFIEFFKELASNNNKGWFDENRERYATVVREPFKLFVQELIARMYEIDPSIAIEAKDAIFRINRDIRFAKDKSPYKINRSAIISPNGRKDKTTPGLYVEFTPEYVRIYGGVYQLATAQVAAVRAAIAKDLKGFDKLINSKDFKNSYGEIKGEKAKRIPKELKELAEKQELLFNKSWYYFVELPPETILKEDLATIIIDNYLKGKPVIDFFRNILK